MGQNLVYYIKGRKIKPYSIYKTYGSALRVNNNNIPITECVKYLGQHLVDTNLESLHMEEPSNNWELNSGSAISTINSRKHCEVLLMLPAQLQVDIYHVLDVPTVEIGNIVRAIYNNSKNYNSTILTKSARHEQRSQKNKPQKTTFLNENV